MGLDATLLAHLRLLDVLIGFVFLDVDVLGGRYSNHHRTSKCPLHRTSENEHPFDLKMNVHRMFILHFFGPQLDVNLTSALKNKFE
jgi:hypothetical protein